MKVVLSTLIKIDGKEVFRHDKQLPSIKVEQVDFKKHNVYAFEHRDLNEEGQLHEILIWQAAIPENEEETVEYLLKKKQAEQK